MDPERFVLEGHIPYNVEPFRRWRVRDVQNDDVYGQAMLIQDAFRFRDTLVSEHMNDDPS